MSSTPICIRRWLLVPALVVLALVLFVAVRVLTVIRHSDQAMSATVFKRGPRWTR